MKSYLKKTVYRPLPMEDIHPEGWLLNQLKIQAAGLSGNLDKFWPDIKDSQWIGGTAEGWERLPYWLDGFIPLAWLLGDGDMKSRAKRYIDYIINHQSSDGWICPVPNMERSRYDMWALFLLLKVLVVYHDATNDPRIEDVVYKALKALDRHIDGATLFNWAHTRWFEGLISIWWLYEKTPEEWLIHLAAKIHSQGFDWQSFFKNWPYQKPDVKGRWSQMSHVVNNAMMLKSGALLWRMTGESDDLHSAESMIHLLDTYHGMVTGVFTGDECLAGTSPVQGTELCAVAEYMYSLEHLLTATGRVHWGDRLEKAAYNALPATFSPDMWTHQYDQQVNQVQCSRQKDPVFNTNGGESNLFGLEPNYGCCTANLSQAWPKLALSTFLRSEDGLAAAVYAPASASLRIKEIPVSVSLNTDYPFRDTLHFCVKAEKPVQFNFQLRIPHWVKEASIKIDGQSIPVTPGTFYSLEREWNGEVKFTLHLPMEPSLVSRPNNLYAITRGPLVYALAPGEDWVRINEDVIGREHPHCDYEVYPTTPWNYGLCLNQSNLLSSIEIVEYPIGKMPYSPAGAPLRIKVHGKKIDWPMVDGRALPYPELTWISDEIEELELIPYGCTNLRMTEMPLV